METRQDNLRLVSTSQQCICPLNNTKDPNNTYHHHNTRFTNKAHKNTKNGEVDAEIAGDLAEAIVGDTKVAVEHLPLMDQCGTIQGKIKDKITSN